MVRVHVGAQQHSEQQSFTAMSTLTKGHKGTECSGYTREGEGERKNGRVERYHRYREREDRESQKDKEKKNLLNLKERIFKIWQERQNNTLQKSKLYLLVFICWGCQIY